MMPVLQSETSEVEGSATDDRLPVPLPPADPAMAAQPRPSNVRRIFSGTSVLATGVFIERGAGFVANILAARLGGAATFGAYSLAITTANNIATYAGAGIGSTSARFSGKYPYGTSGYAVLARVLITVAALSAIVAGSGLWLTAAPIAHLLGQPGAVGLLRASAISAMGIVLLECARGFFVGQRRLVALILLSMVVALGMIVLLPATALQHNPVRMITAQGATTTVAVLVCILLSGPLGLLARTPPSASTAAPRFPSVLREVWSFGFMQLAGLAGANAAGWWLTTLVARADTSLVQMGFLGIASQLRNIVGLAPSLLTEGSFAVMADPLGESSRTPQRVLAFTTYVSSLVSFALAAAGILIAPWMLRLLYAGSYSQAAPAVAFALALAVMHMGNAPASARLSILSVRASAIINTLWAIFVAAAGTFVMLRTGSAVIAMVIYFAAHTLSSLLVLLTLSRRDELPEGVTLTFAIATLSTLALACAACYRSLYPQLTLTVTAFMALFSFAALWLLLTTGRRHGWLPNRAHFEELCRRAKSSLSHRRQAHGR